MRVLFRHTVNTVFSAPVEMTLIYFVASARTAQDKKSEDTTAKKLFVSLFASAIVVVILVFVYITYRC